jgi:Domain of unknown function (DUF4136)
MKSLLTLLGVAVVVWNTTALAQKVKVDYDKTADFAHYRRYAWGDNYLLTSQRPEDQNRIDMALRDSINRQLQLKGFVPDETRPDFRIEYEAGGMLDAQTGVKPDLLRTRTMGYETSLDVWTSVLGKMKITVTDVASQRTVWQALASKKIGDPTKFMRDLNKEIDTITAKTLKGFPAK